MDDLKNLSAIFQDRVFHIPDYQRGYAWKNEQINDLIEDLEDLERLRAQRPSYMHFTGTIVLKPMIDAANLPKSERIPGKTFYHYDIVDGQQRLTSLVILLSEIARALKAKGDEWAEASKNLVEGYITRSERKLWLFHLGADLNDFFRRCVVEGASSKMELDSQQLLIGARDKFRAYIEKRKNTSPDPYKTLDELSEIITHGLGFVVHEVKGEHEVSVIFETVNSRGRELTQFEKTKNLLFFLSGRYVENIDLLNDLSSQLNSAWIYILRELHKGGKEASEDQFLQYHWVIFKEALWYEDNRIDNTYDIHRAIKQTSKTSGFKKSPAEWIKAYLASLRQYIGVYCDIVTPSRDGAFSEVGALQQKFVETCESLDRIDRQANLVPLLMASYERFQKDSAELLNLFKLIETFSFRLLVQGRYSNVGRSRAFDLAREIAGGAFPTEVAKSKTRENLINYYCGDEAFREALLSKGNFYAWSGIRYFLFEYECYRAKETKRAIPIDWKRFMALDKENSIEHVLPQGENTLGIKYWSSRFSPDQWEENRHRLGNLCISEHGANAAYSNRGFDEKAGHSSSNLETTYANSNFQSEKDLTKFKDWVVESIDQRQQDLMKFALSRWKS